MDSAAQGCQGWWHRRTDGEGSDGKDRNKRPTMTWCVFFSGDPTRVSEFLSSCSCRYTTKIERVREDEPYLRRCSSLAMIDGTTTESGFQTRPLPADTSLACASRRKSSGVVMCAPPSSLRVKLSISVVADFPGGWRSCYPRSRVRRRSDSSRIWGGGDQREDPTNNGMGHQK